MAPLFIFGDYVKNIIITGVSTGIGYSTTKTLVDSEYRVFGSVRKEEDAENLKQELGENFHPLIFDPIQLFYILKKSSRNSRT